MYLHFCMTQPAIDSKRLAQQLDAAIRRKRMTYKQIAKTSGIEASRISKFCNAEFKRVTPVLKKLCIRLEVPLEDPAANHVEPITNDIFESVRTLVGKSSKKAKAVRRLIQSVELLIKEQP